MDDKEFQKLKTKWSEKARKILNGTYENSNKKSSNIKITKDSILYKKYLRQND